MPPVFCMSEFVDHTIFGARAEPLFGILVEGIGVRPSQQVESAGNRLDAPPRAPRAIGLMRQPARRGAGGSSRPFPSYAEHG